VAVLRSTRGDWPEGRAFYHFDHVYDRSSLGYAGPTFGFSAMPDQYALAAFAARELGRPHQTPVMAQVELSSSHAPWAPLPTRVDPAALGDGSVFRSVKARAVTARQLSSNRPAIPAAYRTSIAYSLTSLLSFVEQHADDDLVLVMLGDHQPSTVVSGFGGNRDVPISIIARDPAVLQRISAWGWRCESNTRRSSMPVFCCRSTIRSSPTFSPIRRSTPRSGAGAPSSAGGGVQP